MKEIRDHEHPVGGSEDAALGLLHREKLIERVDLHELKTSRVKDVGSWHDCFGSGKHPAGARVAVADGIPEESPVWSDE